MKLHMLATPAAVLAVAMLTLSACGGSAAASISSTLGPQLVLVSAAPDRVAALDALPMALHAQVEGDAQARYIGSGDGKAVGRVQAQGLVTTVLDPSTQGKVYYFVEAAAEEERATVLRLGSVVYSDTMQILLAVPASRERAFLDTAAKHAVHIQLLTNDRLALTQRAAVAAVPAPVVADPIIAALADRVTTATLSALIADLSGEQAVDLGSKTTTLNTRYTFAGSSGNAGLYVQQHLVQHGLAPRAAPWVYGRYRGNNIVADIGGNCTPERIWIIGGHLDDTSQKPYTRAPGADDNASGVAAVLSIADILYTHQFSDTIRFVVFTGEEQGMWGSKSYAAQLRSEGAQVMGFINLDMLGYDGNGDSVVEIHSGLSPASQGLANAFISANARYGTGLVVENKQGNASRFSDHSSFWDRGYPAVMAIENFFAGDVPADHTPSYHKTGDLLSSLQLDYAARYTRAALATIAESAGIIGPATPTVTSTPAATPQPAATPGAMALPAVCRDVLLSGNMEASEGWKLSQTSRPPRYVEAPVFSGAHSLRTGIAGDSGDRASHSSAQQRVTIPANATSVELTGEIWQKTEDTSGDYQEILLLDSSLRTLAVLMRDRADSESWQPFRLDLSQYAGKTVTVYLNTFNDGDGRRTVMFLDDLRLVVCAP